MNLRIYIAGQDSIGRKALIQTYMTGDCDKSEYSGYLFDIQHKKIIFDKKKIDLFIQIDESAENTRSSRIISYGFADVVVFCFCLVNQYSYDEIENNYRQEILEYCKDKPYILVGLKKDKRDRFDFNNVTFYENNKITTEDGERLKNIIKAQYYIECSSWEHENVNEVFETVIRLGISNKNDIKQDQSMNKKRNSKALCNIF
ncbi:hypothetical protein M9Y10_007767 [Tritrichomonas musculus]|uniref:Uncharacterized protein n=1 Tax=Tritrichomonas musculus TaxID=1915356 RepID=A0ABR2J319_9EUKA